MSKQGHSVVNCSKPYFNQIYITIVYLAVIEKNVLFGDMSADKLTMGYLC